MTRDKFHKFEGFRGSCKTSWKTDARDCVPPKELLQQGLKGGNPSCHGVALRSRMPPRRFCKSLFRFAGFHRFAVRLGVGIFFVSWLAHSLSGAAAEPVLLAADGEPRAAIVLPAEPDAQEQTAADELVEHIRLISGVELPVRGSVDDVEGLLPVYLGAAADAVLDVPLRAGKGDPASFALRVMPERIDIRGLSPEGTLFGVYALLEQLGVRWYVPGAIGRIVPERADLAVVTQNRLEIPSFAGRHLQAIGDLYGDGNVWARRMRLGGFNAGSHGLAMQPPPDRQTEPELFMLEGGRGQVRVSHPETLRRTVAAVRHRLDIGRVSIHDGVRYVNIGPDDGHGFGEDPWDADDMDPLHGRVSTTDRYIRFFNQVLEAVADDHPDAGIAFYCYSQHMRAPVREQPHPNILPVLAPIDVCRFHAIDNPHCWERHYIRQIVDDWSALGTRMMYRGYLFNLADPALPFSMIRQVAAELPWFHANGMFAARIQAQADWAYHGPTLYLAARLMWDAGTDVEAVLDDYFRGMYGKGATALRAHFEIMEDAFEQADYHTGSTFDFPHILTPDVLAQLETTLAEAERRTADRPGDAARVAMVRLAFDYGATFLGMMDAINRFDFEAANTALNRIYDTLIPAATAHEPSILNRRFAPRFVDRFWRNTVREGYARSSGGNQILARLPDEWLVMLDPHDGGEALGLYKPNIGGNAWMSLKTYSRSWANQGLRYFKGDQAIVWYRTTVEMPAGFDPSDDLFLWLSGVDNRAEAWINGRKLERIRAGAAPVGRSWEFDAKDTLLPGHPNLIVLKVSNDSHRELGTGGLTAPAMLWRAAGPDSVERRPDVGFDPLEFLPGQ